MTPMPWSRDESGRAPVPETISLIRIPLLLPARPHILCIMYRELPMEGTGGAGDGEGKVSGLCGAQLSVGEFRDLVRLDFSPLATTTPGQRCVCRVAPRFCPLHPHQRGPLISRVARLSHKPHLP